MNNADSFLNSENVRVYGFLITSCSLGDIASLHSAIFYFNMVLLLVRVTLLQWRGF